MKKLILGLLVLTSCTESKEPIPIFVNGARLIEFEFRGHQYIEFEKERATWGVHNPDCKCKK
jgi:hypothetical protein